MTLFYFRSDVQPKHLKQYNLKVIFNIINYGFETISIIKSAI